MTILQIRLKEEVSSFKPWAEVNDYFAASFVFGAKKGEYRKAKITPKKFGQFVAIWTRAKWGETRPFCEGDLVDLLVIEVEEEGQRGFFLFSKSVCLERGIFSSDQKEGKRGMRVYPPWSKPTNTTALATKQWQQEFFHLV